MASYGDDAAAAKSGFRVAGHQVAGGATAGGVVGLVVGLFAPPLLAATAVGVGIGAAAGAIAKHHGEKKIASAVDEDQWLPLGSSAIVAVIDDEYLDKVDVALASATKKVNKAIDKGDYDDIVKALNKGGQQVVQAVGAAA